MAKSSRHSATDEADTARAEPGVGRDRPAPLHETLRAHARANPDRPAYLWYGQPLSYGELDRASDGFAARLIEIGVRKGEPVALFMQNCPQYVIAHYGIQKIGAIVCPCDPLNKGHELEYQLGDLGARVIVVAEPLLATLAKVREHTAIEHLFAVFYADLLPAQPSIAIPDELDQMRRAARTVPSGVEDFLVVARSGKRPGRVDVSMDDTALMLYTSGSTGLPKGAMLSFGNARYKTDVSLGIYALRDDDTLLAAVPLYYIAGTLMSVDMAMAAGATVVLMHRFDPLAILQAIERHRVTWWYSIAPMSHACLQVPGAREFDLSSLVMNPATSFGMTFTETIADQWRELAPNCRSFEVAYGLSETYTMDTAMPPEAIRWGTQGKPVPGNEVRIVHPDTGEQMPVDEQGEIVVRGPGVFKGYWNKPDATAKTLRDGWLHTGDMGRIDADGYLTFLGRFKEMIKVSGYSVFPEEVESILIRHPAIAQAGVIGIADPNKGEVVKAFIVLNPGLADPPTEADIIQWARENMAIYKVPREIMFRPSLPASGAGKLLRRLLKND